MGILEQFGIETKLFIVQLINFGVLAIVLWKWVLPRLTNLMEQRRKSIEESLAAAERARTELAEAEAKREEELKEAREQALAIIAEAKKEAKSEGDRVLAGAKAEADTIVSRAERKLEAESQKLRTELRAELAGMTIEATRQVLAKVVKEEDSRKILQEAIKTVEKGSRARHS